MTLLLPLFAIVLAALGVFLVRGNAVTSENLSPTEGDVGKPGGFNFGAAAIIAVLGIIGIARFAPAADQFALQLGWTVSIIVASVASLIMDKKGSGPIYLALGCVAPASVVLLPDAVQGQARLAVIAGIGLASILFYGSTSTARVALVSGIVTFVAILGKYNTSVPSLTQGGLVVALGASLIGLVILLIEKSFGEKGGGWLKNATPILGAVLLAGLAYVVGTKYFALFDSALCMLLGIGAALVVTWVNPVSADSTSTDKDPFRLAISSVIWIGLATLAFGLARGFGMSVALVAATGFLILQGNSKAIITIAPLVGLVVFRVFRQVYPDTTKLMDIGQHNAMIGFVLGATLPLLPTEWMASHRVSNSVKANSGAILWVLLVGGATILVELMLGSRGSIALATGLGFSALFAGTRRLGASAEASLATAIGASGFILLTHAWLFPFSDLTREDKQKWFLWAFVAIAIAATALYFLAQKTSSQPSATSNLESDPS